MRRASRRWQAYAWAAAGIAAALGLPQAQGSGLRMDPAEPLMASAPEMTTPMAPRPVVQCEVYKGTIEDIKELQCGVFDFFVKKHTHELDVACEEAHELPVATPEWYRTLAYTLMCVICAAMAAGLTLGLTSIDEFGLKVICNELAEEVAAEASDEEEATEVRSKLLADQHHAQRILPVITGHYFSRGCGWLPRCLNPTNEHYLLVTLLLANATANEALPLFLDKLVPSWLAILVSVTVVLIFGEIIPSAIFTGPSQLKLAACFAPVVKLVKLIVIPVVWPISLLLDKCLGHEEEEHSRAHIKAMIRTLKLECLEDDEASMLQGVLEMHHKTASSVAKPIEKARMLPSDMQVNLQCIGTIASWGHSRLFVYHRNLEDSERRDDIMGVLLAKKLLCTDLLGQPLASTVDALKVPVVLGPGDNLLQALSKFQEGMCHLAIISPKPELAEKALLNGETIPPAARPTGFCALEDVIEQLLKVDIYDEVDAEQERWLHEATMRTVTAGRRERSGSMSFGSRSMTSSHVSFAIARALASRTVMSHATAAAVSRRQIPAYSEGGSSSTEE